MPRTVFHILAIGLTAAAPAPAQRVDPIQWSLSLEPAAAPPGAEILARLKAAAEPGWHLYSLSTPKGGPIPTTIAIAENPAIESFQIYQTQPVRKFDPNFNLETETFYGGAEFLLRLKLRPGIAPGPIEVTAQTRYQACTEKLCLPPVRRTASATLTIDPQAPAPAAVIPAGLRLFDPAAAAPEAPARPARAPSAEGVVRFLLVAFGFGIAAIFTPCVFPMIPITMSFFLQRHGGSRADSVVQAALFCLGIVVLFSALGLATTAALGPFGIVLLGSNPWVNAFVAAVLLAFALSLLGAFEITLPSGVLTRLDRASQRGGILGTLLMGLTFSLTAFACVGPFVGTLLAASLPGGGLRPLLGMVAFACGLALPFFFLALFPSLMKRMPKSGGWLPRVKVVLGFVILAAMLKYLSNVDQVLQFNVLTRERFLAAWVVLFALPGLYLLGLLRLEGVKPDESLGVARLLVGSFFIVFALSLVPGMFGARLGELDAYVPPANSWPAAANPSRAAWMKNQYREALDKARREGKLLFVNFTGYACTNCHWMKANMFPRPAVAEALGGFVLLELYTDGTDPASEVNQKLQQDRFGTIAIPFYAILNAEEKVLATFAGLTRNEREFLAFLRSATS